MTKVKAVIFDYGNVLSISPLDSDTSSMAKILDTTVDKFEQAYWQYRLDYDCGLSSNVKYWQLVSDALNKSVNENQIEELTKSDVLSWSRPNLEVVQYANELVEKGIELALLSNMPTDLKNWVENSCNWLPKFNHRTYSCKLNCAKPDSEIYKHSINGLKSPLSKTVFVDDRKENIEAAKTLGVNSILFSDIGKLKDSIESIV